MTTATAAAYTDEKWNGKPFRLKHVKALARKTAEICGDGAWRSDVTKNYHPKPRKGSPKKPLKDVADPRAKLSQCFELVTNYGASAPQISATKRILNDARDRTWKRPPYPRVSGRLGREVRAAKREIAA